MFRRGDGGGQVVPGAWGGTYPAIGRRVSTLGVRYLYLGHCSLSI